jgi:hypothetical protein
MGIDYQDENLCMSKVMEFDVDERYLMGFMGSGKEDSFLTQLGPVVTKKIKARTVSNLDYKTAEDPTSDASKASSFTRAICNDDEDITRKLTFSY